MEDDSQGENIAGARVGLNWVSGFNFKDLWSHIARSTTSSVEVLGAGEVLCQPKVHDDWDDPVSLYVVPLDHDVLKLEVAVHDSLLVKVENSLQEVDHDDLGLIDVGETALLKVPIER